jgi:uncharacterized protein YndB with AHSA1/START domain
MLETEITIERPLATVWKYFTECKTWERWWGGGMKSAQWRKGGKLVWTLGGSSEILDITPGQVVIIRGSWMDTRWEFEAVGPTSTRVRIASAPRGGASFSDGGASHLAEMRNSLRRLKQCVETETTDRDPIPSDDKGVSAQKRWWEFWK